MKEYLDKFKQIPYEEQTPAQRWSVICAKEREKRNWVRRNMAQYFGVVTSTVTFWEQANSYPKNEYIYKMAELIKVTPDELINHLNNTEKMKHGDEEINSVNKIIEFAKTMSDEEILNIISNLAKLLIIKKSGGQGGQLSLSI